MDLPTLLQAMARDEGLDGRPTGVQPELFEQGGEGMGRGVHGGLLLGLRGWTYDPVQRFAWKHSGALPLAHSAVAGRFRPALAAGIFRTF
jgi:hypothetical protein